MTPDPYRLTGCLLCLLSTVAMVGLVLLTLRVVAG